MQKNLFQKTFYEIYKSKETLGYKIIETPNMFVGICKNPKILGLTVAHCEKFTQNEFDFIEKEFENIDICIGSNTKAEINSPKLIFEEIAQAMLFETGDLLTGQKKFEIKLVKNRQDINLFCEIAGDVFHMEDDISELNKLLSLELGLNNSHKYIGYIQGEPAGIIEVYNGSEASLVQWVGVKEEFRRQGLCRAMLEYAINQEITKGCQKFVLVATEMGAKVYENFGFKTIASRYDYIWKSKN